MRMRGRNDEFARELRLAERRAQAPYGMRGPLGGGLISVSGFDGNFGKLAQKFNLTVIHYFRGDLGVTGTSGTGKGSWANQLGASTAITPHGTATNGIGSVGAGLNGRASVVTNGVDQKGMYTAPALAPPATTAWTTWMIARQLSGGSASPRGILQQTGGANDLYWQSATIVNQVQAGGTTVTNETGAQNVWFRWQIVATGVDATSHLQIGSNTTQSPGVGNVALNVNRTFSDLLTKMEFLCILQAQGAVADIAAYNAAASPLAQKFWTNAIQI